MSAVRCELNAKLQGKDYKFPSKSDADYPAAIANEIVSEILETAMDIAGKPAVGDIYDTDGEEQPQKPEECKEKVKKGLGDQLEGKAELVTRPTPSRRHPPVEKKYRLTDLVKNSKQMLARYVLQEVKPDTVAEREEKLISVTDLDVDTPGCSKASVDVVDEDTLDEIKLPAAETSGDSCKKTMTFPMASSTAGRSSFMQRCRTLKAHAGDGKKKKWAFGAKLAQFLKRGGGQGKEKKKEDVDEKDADEGEGEE